MYFERALKLLALASVCIIAVACSDSNVRVGSQESAKQPADSDSKPADDKATEPQVVTGAYLACVVDSSTTTASGEIGFGCGVYSSKDDSKVDLADRKLALTAQTEQGKSLPSRQVDDPASSRFHGHIFLNKAFGDNVVIKAELQRGGSGTPIQVFSVRPITVDDNVNPLKMEKKYTPSEISSWCAIVTTTPFDPSNIQHNLERGTACGADYLSDHGSVAPLAASVLSAFTYTSTGICEKEGLTSNQAANVQRCSH